MTDVYSNPDKSKEYYFFFDESQKTDYITIDENGKPNFDNENDLHSFVGVFCGFKGDGIQDVRIAMEAIESKCKESLNMNFEHELKSTTIKKSNFRFGFASIKSNNRAFYKDFFQMLSEFKPILITSFSNKYEILIRRTIRLHGMNEERMNWFYYCLSKFLSTYGPKDFFVTLYNEPFIAIKELSKRLKEMASNDLSIDRSFQRNRAFIEVAHILDNEYYTLMPVKRIHYPYILLPDALTLLLDEIGIRPESIYLSVDGEEGQYDCFYKKPYGVLFVDSKKEPLIRICDHLAGLVARMCSSLKSEPSRREPSIEAESVEKNKLRLLNPRWFKIDKDTFELYKSFYDAIIRTNQYYWSTCTLSYSDDYAYLIAFLSYLGTIESFNDYCKMDYKQRPRDFENYACSYMEGVPKPPCNPSKVLSRYDRSQSVSFNQDFNPV